VIGLAAIAMLVLALAASLIPARRVAAVDPMQALRNE
jgi:ABC-type lipoprotein release transport system permease subunit